MKRVLFIILVILGLVGFFVLKEMEVKNYGGYTFLYYCIIFQARRWYLIRQKNWSFWHFWHPKNILDQFKKP